MTLRQLCGSPKRLLLLLLTLVPLLTACDPKEPTNELLNKRHDNPSYVIFTLKEAKLNDPARWDAEPTLADITLTGREEKMTLSLTSKGFLASEEQGVSQFSVKSTDTESDVVYLLEIDYLDARRELMNGQFIENGQDRIHQHFFERFTRDSSVASGAPTPSRSPKNLAMTTATSMSRRGISPTMRPRASSRVQAIPWASRVSSASRAPTGSSS